MTIKRSHPYKAQRDEVRHNLSPQERDKITRRKASIEKARRVLGYEPGMKMKDGIKRVYDWIMENRDKIEKSLI